MDGFKAIPIGVIFDLWAVRLNPEKAEGKTMVINWTFTDVGEKFITIKFEGEARKLGELIGMLDDIPQDFPIVEPVPAKP